MSTVGQPEKRTQARGVAVLRDKLHYDYLGDWAGRDHHNIAPCLAAKATRGR